MAASFAGGKIIHSVQLSGFATLHAGSLQDSGPATFIASSDGSAQTQFSFASTGTRTETRTALNSTRSCTLSGADGVAHDASGPNCLTALVWFLPQITLQPAVPLNVLQASYGGVQSTEWGPCYVFANQVNLGTKVANASAAAQVQKQSSTTLCLDSSTILPKAVRYELLSDSGTRRIPVEVHYSQYRELSGIMIPGHIERYLNGSLELAIDITEASVLN
jgi:hypothetical protein